MEAIPERREPERYGNCRFSHSRFVRVNTNDQIEVQLQYPLMGMQTAETSCYVREEVYERLLQAAGLLPEGFRFRILDAWRPFALQEELYTVYSARLLRDFALENCTEEQQKAVIRRFVSEPVEDRRIPPVHTTGGAVDLTILDETGQELAMGTAFDAFTDLTYTAAFEKSGDLCVRDNRRLLYHVMTSVGFTNLPSEWWHYDYGDRFWAYYRDEAAFYEGVFTREELYGE